MKTIKELLNILWFLAIVWWVSYVATMGAIAATKHTGITIAIAYNGDAG